MLAEGKKRQLLVERRRERDGSPKLSLMSRNLPLNVVMIRKRVVNLYRSPLVVEARVVSQVPQRIYHLDLNHSNRRLADQGEEEGRGRAGVASRRGEVQEETRVPPRKRLVVWWRRKERQPTLLLLNNNHLLIKRRYVP